MRTGRTSVPLTLQPLRFSKFAKRLKNIELVDLDQHFWSERSDLPDKR
ncbi:hypothetical protein RHDC2_00031 [Rhodocyclaceae bacterium]|nr:hypothetical protein RHDC2_00031 [Rhodocyclaceae bacterium]